MYRYQFRRALLSVATALCAMFVTQAQSFPDKPIRIVLGQAAGGAVDTVARLLAERVTQGLGQQVIVEARPGAGGMIAAEVVARAAPDGYTIGLLDAGALAVNPVLQKRVNYDVAKDFTYIALVAKIPLVLIAHPELPASTLSELTSYLKQNGEKVSYASSGVGGPLHMAMEAYKQKAGVAATHVPYRGGAPGLADVTAGHVPLMFIDTNLGNEYSKSGRVKALAVATKERNAQLPNVPTFHESGLQDFDFVPWVGIVAPTGLPKEVTAKLEQSLREITSSPEMGDKMQSLGFLPLRADAAQFESFVANEVTYYRRLIQEQKLTAE